ncbi:alkaline phosphatase PhoX [Altererythrobacter sp. GH1-8]|uniref:alkaline phosphatase PhoX n=1 Tax=Altererythrobacter sp. GH1-8 TaxID=3349333 RepID=UPI00374CDC8E
MSVAFNRRRFMGATGSAFAALVASGCTVRTPKLTERSSATSAATADLYGSLKSDPAGILDLPEGFSYRIISCLGDAMDDGELVPDRGDGMGSFDLGNGKIALVRNHELRAEHGPEVYAEQGFLRGEGGGFLPGGTTTIILDAETLAVERQFRSLAGTWENCAGGVTPWGSWLTCEEPGRFRRKIRDGHGWVFEVPASATGPVPAVPLKAMGRFEHEAACVDPATGIVYLTEDREDGLFYRFIPDVPGQLAQGGRLQALAVEAVPDTRNQNQPVVEAGVIHWTRWIDMDNVESPADDLRQRGAAKGASLFFRGEGIHMGDSEIYFCCTGGGTAKCGQIFRLLPGRDGGVDRLELFFESESKEQFYYGDNLTIAPNGDLIVCEDEYADLVDNRLIGITPEGKPYVFGRLNIQTELAGACFSPDGQYLFVNAYSPTKTFAIRGPWA